MQLAEVNRLVSYSGGKVVDDDELHQAAGLFRARSLILLQAPFVNPSTLWQSPRSFYYQTSSIFPYLVLAPNYFRGQITLGTMFMLFDVLGTRNSSLAASTNSGSLREGSTMQPKAVGRKGRLRLVPGKLLRVDGRESRADSSGSV